MGGLPEDPRTDPQDRSWFGPHDRLFTSEESEELDFINGPEYGWFLIYLFLIKSPFHLTLCFFFLSLVLGLGWSWRFGWTGCRSDLGESVE